MKNPVNFLLLKIVLLSLVLLICGGCPTEYQSGKVWGYGYDDEKIEYNIYAVRFVGNPFTSPEKSADFALLHAAELTLKKGFKYFLLLNPKTGKKDTKVYTQCGPRTYNLPISGTGVLCYREEPIHLEDYYNAQKIFSEIVRRCEITGKGEYMQPEIVQYVPDFNVVEFEMKLGIKTEPLDPNHVRTIFGVKDFYSEGFLIGRYADLENPEMSINDFAEKVKPKAAQKGANAVLIEDNWRQIQDNPFYFDGIRNPFIGFVADLYILHPVSLGILWEPADLSNGKHVIRKFTPDSKGPEAGLKIGDRVLEINDVDMLDRNGLKELFSNWSPGDIATLTVVREGKEVDIEVPLISN